MPEFRFDSVGEFLAMGTGTHAHAVYVWGSYLAFALVVIWSLWLPRLERTRVVRLLRARHSQQPQQSANADLRPQQGAQQQQGESNRV